MVTLVEKPRAAGVGRPGLGSGLEEENKNRMQRLQRVMCQRFAQSLRVLFQELRMTQEAARSDCRSGLPTWMRLDRQFQIEVTHISFNDRVRPNPDVGQSRKRPLNPMEADVEITSEAINAAALFSVPLPQ
jgi:hypothetical protein